MDSLYEAVGGEPVFRQLILRPLYPEEDLTGAKERQRMFLEQYWGGPTTYSEQRGHPRLRMRHAGWVIGARERDAWLEHMRAAVEELDVSDEARAAIWEHVERAAHTLVNAGLT